MPMPQTMSPRTQSMQAGNVPSDQAKTMFDQGLTSMAYTVLTTKLPNISQDVITFKVLDTDPTKGSGVGAFVVMRTGHPFFIPVVMAGNQIKPLDILYHKDQNQFLPLTKEWMDQIDKTSLGTMGQGVNAPKTLSTDVDIRNTVVPPTTGRYSYASEFDPDIHRMFDEMRNHEYTHKLAFMDVLAAAPNRVKTAIAKMFETRPKLLKIAVANYGVTRLSDSLRLNQEKVASSEGHTTPAGALYIADEKTSPGEFKSIFGAKSPLAFSGMKVKGYYAKDDRKNLNRPVAIQPYMDMGEPKFPGAYRLFRSNGTPVFALVIANPACVIHGLSHTVPPRNIRFRREADAPADPTQGHGSRYRIPGKDGRDNHTYVDRYIGITEDGKIFDVNKLIGEAVAMSNLADSAVYKKTVNDAAAAGPRVGQHGIFVQAEGGSFHGTAPMEIQSISHSGGVRRIQVFSGCGMKTLVTDEKSSIAHMHVSKDSDITYLPANYVWLPAKGQMHQGEFMTSPSDILRWVMMGLHGQGAVKMAASKPIGPTRGYIIGGQEYPFVPALRKLATEAHISVTDAECALKIAEIAGKVEFFIPGKKRTKVAAEGAPPSKKDSGGGDEADPAQAAMDQVMQAQMMQPQGPAPFDMAVAEQMQLLTGQMQSLQQQQQMLQQLQNRANMIAGSGGAQGNPAAAAAAMGGPVDPSQMGAGMPMGVQPGQLAMPPQQPGQQMPPGPQMGGQPAQPQPGQQPNPMQATPMPGQQPQQGQDPNQPQQPPQAMMNSDDGSVENMMGQVNPQFMEQAGQLNDRGVFDAAALASMAQAPSLKDLVGSYTPNLERSLDNMGRVLLTLWMDEDQIKESIGTETYIGIEDNLRTVFKGMGDLILKVNQNSLVMRDPNQTQFQE